MKSIRRSMLAAVALLSAGSASAYCKPANWTYLNLYIGKYNTPDCKKNRSVNVYTTRFGPKMTEPYRLYRGCHNFDAKRRAEYVHDFYPDAAYGLHRSTPEVYVGVYEGKNCTGQCRGARTIAGKWLG